MKNTLGLLSLLLTSFLFLTSCGDDDSGPSFSFKDQNLQGRIDGISFDGGSGYFDEGFEAGEIRITIYDESEDGDVCEIFGSESVYVFFSIPEEIGVYELFFDIDSFEGQTVTLLNPNGEGGIPQNNIASMGAVEILSISDTEVTGRMDATLDSNNTVNGNFTVNSCDTN